MIIKKMNHNNNIIIILIDYADFSAENSNFNFDSNSDNFKNPPKIIF